MPFDRAYQPAVAAGSLYFGSSTDGKVYALDAATGRTRWTFFTDGPVRLAPTVTDGKVYICTKPDTDIPCPDGENFVHAEFAGPHPAGLVGTHIHFLDPVSTKKTVWSNALM